MTNAKKLSICKIHVLHHHSPELSLLLLLLLLLEVPVGGEDGEGGRGQEGGEGGEGRQGRFSLDLRTRFQHPGSTSRFLCSRFQCPRSSRRSDRLLMDSSIFTPRHLLHAGTKTFHSGPLFHFSLFFPLIGSKTSLVSRVTSIC